MGKLLIFLVGILLGAVLMFAGLKYHVVRADDGMHLVPRVTADFSYPYADIRNFGINDWNQHRSLALAIVRADKGALIQDSAMEDMRQGVEGVLDGLWPSTKR